VDGSEDESMKQEEEEMKTAKLNEKKKEKIRK
jgi:hypothetical protein